MGTTITEESALAAIDEAIALKGGDFVYDSSDTCMYFDAHGAPSCIVGHVYAAHGYGPSDVQEGGTPVGYQATRTIHAEEQIRYALTMAQRSQDTGDTWAEARSAFIASMAVEY